MPAFDTIILLVGDGNPAVLASLLQTYNRFLTTRPVATLSDLLALQPESLRRARLVAVTTDVIVPANILDQLGFGAYNFHPGSPDFPGWAPAHFAIHNRATQFGATAHLITERVDAGPIVGVELFPIPRDIDVAGLERLACIHVAYLIMRLAKLLATQIEPLPELPIRWSGIKHSRRSYAATFDTSDLSKEP
jgi:methionyl-tRNA formyltransferase